MLAKLLGAGLIIGSTTYAGWQAAAALARRPAELRDLQTALAVLHTEVEYGATPMPAALEEAGAAAGGPVAAIFWAAAARLRSGGGITPGDALRSALKEHQGATALTRDDGEILLALAPVLGASGRADQVRHLALARERLAAEEARARDDRTRYEKIARYLGVLSGATLVLILF